MSKIKYQIPEGHSIEIKWPQMLTTGEQVTEEQAFEIIRRTDTFITDPNGGFGNNEQLVSRMRQMLGLQSYIDLEAEWHRRNVHKNLQGNGSSYWTSGWDLREVISGSLGNIPTSYIHNTWASSSYIGGPGGWCHPDGVINFSMQVGKWPTLDEVVGDWARMLDAFPFIKVNVSMYDDEEKYGTNSVKGVPKATSNLIVGDGEIKFVDSDSSLHNSNHSNVESDIDKFHKNINNPYRELGLTFEWLERAGELQRPTVEKIVDIARQILERSRWKDRDALDAWLSKCLTTLQVIDFSKVPQHAIIHENFITEGGINFPHLTAEEVNLPV